MNLRETMRHAFSLGGSLRLDDDGRTLLDRLAEIVVSRRMAEPALLFLESVKPLGFLGGQAMHFLSPFATMVLNPSQYRTLAHIMAHREGVEALMDAIVRRQGRDDAPGGGHA